jgi:hypothetical protein
VVNLKYSVHCKCIEASITVGFLLLQLVAARTGLTCSCSWSEARHFSGKDDLFPIATV